MSVVSGLTVGDDQTLRVVGREHVELVLGIAPEMFPHWDWARIREQMEFARVVQFGGMFVLNTLSPPFPGGAIMNRAAGDRDYPNTASMAVTNRCAGSCTYCSNKKKKAGKDLPLQTVLEIITQLQELKVPLINISGGEPLLRDDLEEIVGAIDTERSAALIATSGYTPEGFLTIERARALKSAGLTYMVVSLDHHDRAKNDAIRFPGAYDAAIASIANSMEAGLFTSTNVVVTSDNFADLETYIREISAMGVHGIRVADVIPSGEYLGRSPLTPDERAEVVELHKRLVFEPGVAQLTTVPYFEGPRDELRCGAGGNSHMYIDAEGGLRPCDFVPIIYGDLTREPLQVAFDRMRRNFRVPAGACIMQTHGLAIAGILGERDAVHYEEISQLMGLP